MKTFGFALFDDDKSPGPAWISVDGATARRISGVNELSTDTTWLTNFSYEAFFGDTELWRNPWLRHDAYLVVKPNDILQEWGYQIDAVTPDFIASFLAKNFSVIMRLAIQLATDVDVKIKASDLFVGKTLRDDLRLLLPEAEFPQNEAASIMKSGQSFIEMTKTMIRGIKGGKAILLRRPRVSYAVEMLTAPIPVGPFDFVSGSRLSGAETDRIVEVRESPKPCLVEVSVRRVDGDIAPVYGFGNSMDKEKRIPRSWVAHPEFVLMSSFSDVEVRSLWRGNKYETMGARLPEAITRFLSSPYTDCSWAAGVIAETLWRAACLGQSYKKNVVDRPQTSWRGAWIKSVDKVSMFHSALKLAASGYNVVSYGLGWVRVVAADESIPDLVADALSMGLLPKPGDIPEGRFSKNKKIPWGGDAESMMFAQMAVTKETQLLWNLNKLPLLDENSRKKMLTELMSAYKNGSI